MFRGVDLPLVIKWSVPIGFHNQFVPVHYSRVTWVAGSGSLCHSGDEWKHYRDFHEKKKKVLRIPWCHFGAGFPHAVRGGAKLLIEFDGASAALWNDISRRGLLPLTSLLQLPLSSCDGWINKDTKHFYPSNAGQVAAGFRTEAVGQPWWRAS